MFLEPPGEFRFRASGDFSFIRTEKIKVLNTCDCSGLSDINSNIIIVVIIMITLNAFCCCSFVGMTGKGRVDAENHRDSSKVNHIFYLSAESCSLRANFAAEFQRFLGFASDER